MKGNTNAIRTLLPRAYAYCRCIKALLHPPQTPSN